MTESRLPYCLLKTPRPRFGVACLCFVLSMGGGFALAPLASASSGTLKGFGSNAHGQLGIGRAGSSAVGLPEQIGSNAIGVAVGHYHSLYLKADGTLWAMGQ